MLRQLLLDLVRVISRELITEIARRIFTPPEVLEDADPLLDTIDPITRDPFRSDSLLSRFGGL